MSSDDTNRQAKRAKKSISRMLSDDETTSNGVQILTGRKTYEPRRKEGGGFIYEPCKRFRNRQVNALDDPVFFKMNSYSKRVRSFEHWINYSDTSHTDLAECGFFYSGMGDGVKCFCCGGALMSWRDTDNVWEEHAKWYPNCPFVIYHKGQAFVDKMKERFPNLMRLKTKFDPPKYQEVFDRTFDMEGLKEAFLEIFEEAVYRTQKDRNSIMSFAIRGESMLVDGPLRKDYYVYNDVTKVRLENEDGKPLSFHQLTMQEGGAIQRFKAILKHEGKLVIVYSKSGKDHRQSILPADEFVLYSPSIVVMNPDTPPFSFVLQGTDRYVKPNGQIDLKIQPQDETWRNEPPLNNEQWQQTSRRHHPYNAWQQKPIRRRHFPSWNQQ